MFEGAVAKVLKGVEVLRHTLNKLLELWMSLWTSSEKKNGRTQRSAFQT